MKRVAIFLIIVNLIGCTTLRPIDGTATDIRERILSGQLLKAGDRVKVLTTSADAYEFTVTNVHDGTISGRSVAIPVTRVTGVLKRELSVGKTALLVGGLILAGAVAANSVSTMDVTAGMKF
jgi:hypothetical protein